MLVGLGIKGDTDNVPRFRFPSEREERQKWISSLSNANLKCDEISNNMTICAKHWTGWNEGTVETINRFSKATPKYPPVC